MEEDIIIIEEPVDSPINIFEGNFYKGDKGDTPYIVDGYWWISGVNTGKVAQGPKGNDGLTTSVNEKEQVNGEITLLAGDLDAYTKSEVNTIANGKQNVEAGKELIPTTDLAKIHEKNKDFYLDFGGANQVSATQAKAGYNHSIQTHAPADAEANILESIQRNGIDLVITNKSVNISVPTQPSDINAEPALGFVPEQSGVAQGLITQLLDGASIEYNTLKKLENQLLAVNSIIGGSAPDGDSIVNTVAELLAVFSTFPEGSDMVTLLTAKLNTSDVYNALDQLLAGKALDARQGKVLSDLCTFLRADLNSHLLAVNPHGITPATISAYTILEINLLLAQKQNSINFVSQTANKFLRDDNSFQTIEQAIGGYANNLYFNEIASDVVGYETLSYEPEVSQTIESWSVTSSEGDKLLKNYLYPTAVGVTSIPAGLWSVLMYGKVSSSSSTTQMGITYFARHIDNSETDLFTVWSDEINNISDEWISFQITNPAFALVETDRMGARVKIRTTSGGTRTVTYAVGDGYGAFINNPNRIRHNQLRAYNEDVTVQHIDSNTEKVTIIDADSIVIWDSVAAKAVRSTFAHIKTVLATIFAPKISSTTVATNTVIDGTFNAIESDGVGLSHTLPAAATYPNKEWTITNSNSSNCILVGTLHGDINPVLKQYESITFYSDGTKLIIK